MDAREILLTSVEARWKKYRSELKTCRTEFSEEAVHDLRVATRRLLAVFDLLRAVIQHKRIQKIRRELKEQLDELDDLRDTQVMLADISEFIHDVPEMEVLRSYLLKREKKLLRLARDLVKSREPEALSRRMEKTSGLLASLPGDSLGEQLLEVVDEAYAKVIRRHDAVDTERTVTIHKLRIAFKKFRYLIEMIHPLLENFPQENFERMHDYQTMMGEVQDMDVAWQQVKDLAENDPSPAFEAMDAHYAARLRKAVLGFVEDKGEALTFWRPAPNQSFPWEKQS